MPAVEELKLSLQAFHERYDGEKPYFENWDGETVQQSMPTRLHSRIQKILVARLDALGFDAGRRLLSSSLPPMSRFPM
jgi:Uma2 family endonuclease